MATLRVPDIEKGHPVVTTQGRTSSVASIGRPAVQAASATEALDEYYYSGRRRVRMKSFHEQGKPDDVAVGDDGEADTLTRIGRFYQSLSKANLAARWAVYVLPVGALLGIPVALFATRFKDVRADGVRLLGLFVWIQVTWGSLWVSRLIASCLPQIYIWLTGVINSGVRKYHIVLTSIQVPVAVLFWTIIAQTTAAPICLAFDTDKRSNPPYWIRTLQKVFLASVAVAGMILVEKVVIQLISIGYQRTQLAPQTRVSKSKARMLVTLFTESVQVHPMFGSKFNDLDYLITTGAAVDKESSAKVLADIRRAGREASQAFGLMASEITGKTLFQTNGASQIVTEALESKPSSEALARRIWHSISKSSSDGLVAQDLINILGSDFQDAAEELFKQLDADDNGDVSEEEMVALVIAIGEKRYDLARSLQDVTSAVKVLDRFLQLIVIVGVGLVYGAFFSRSFSTYLATIGTQIAAVSFAIARTVQEFLGSCIFIFVKHPYDVGDRVDINRVQLVVEKISLLYTRFHRVDNKKTVLISNITNNEAWIENISRSGALRERIELKVSASTSFDDVGYLKEEIERHLSLPENNRDFRPEVDVELVDVGDLSSLQLAVTAVHKVSGNFYSFFSRLEIEY
jgi:Ca2+-binding EF-hand superfamily protein